MEMLQKYHKNGNLLFLIRRDEPTMKKTQNKRQKRRRMLKIKKPKWKIEKKAAKSETKTCLRQK